MQTLQTGKPVAQDDPGLALGFEQQVQGTENTIEQAATTIDWPHSDDFLKSLAAFKSHHQAVQ